MERVLITGGRGLIGQNLRIRLEEQGYEVVLLSRGGGKDLSKESLTWDIYRGEIDRDALNTCDYIIHLAGANMGALRWTRKRKKEILDSRIKSANLIFNNLDQQNRKLKAFISASAIGYYGAINSDHIFKEADPSSRDFLGQTCKLWEDAADQFSHSGIRTVKIRAGIVLSRKGGALPRLHRPVKLGFGAPIGHGKQYMPWIHMDDLCTIYLQALEQNDMQGAYNAVAPEHITNKGFTRKLAQILNRPLWIPNIPAFGLKLLFGEMAQMLLTGSRISSDRIQKAGFIFRFPDLDTALQELYSR